MNLETILQNTDREELMRLIDEYVDRDELLARVDDELQPHFDDVRRRAQSENGAEARQYYASLSEEEQQQAFNAAVADLVAVLRDCREDPQVGFPKLKGRLRDPDVMEPLLLIFDNPDRIDPAYTRELKEFAAETVRWAGSQVVPEMYSQSELQSIVDNLEGQNRG